VRQPLQASPARSTGWRFHREPRTRTWGYHQDTKAPREIKDKTPREKLEHREKYIKEDWFAAVSRACAKTPIAAGKLQPIAEPTVSDKYFVSLCLGGQWIARRFHCRATKQRHPAGPTGQASSGTRCAQHANMIARKTPFAFCSRQPLQEPICTHTGKRWLFTPPAMA